MELVQKLTPKSMGWDRFSIGEAIKNIPQNGKLLLGRVGGIVTGLRQTIDKETGDIQTGLKGNFRGVGSRDNIQVTSGVCYLPQGIQAMLEGELAAAKETDEKANVRFVLDIYAFPESNKAGYSFKAESIVRPEAEDPLANLLAEADKILALPSPEKADKKPA